MQAKPETREQIEPLLTDLSNQWRDLEATTKEKGERLFDANRATLYQQSCDDVDGWITSLESQIVTPEDFGKDLTTVNLQEQKQNVRFQNVQFAFIFVLLYFLEPEVTALDLKYIKPVNSQFSSIY